jgi:hypothetical protein
MPPVFSIPIRRGKAAKPLTLVHIISQDKKKSTLYFHKMPAFDWCPAAESNYELILTMDLLCRLTSGAASRIIVS